MFQGLKISENTDLCDEFYNEHSYLLEGPQVRENDRKVFEQLADEVSGNPTDAMLKTSIALLMKLMRDYYGKPVILLLDEYDVPIAKASSNGYYAEMLEIIRGIGCVLSLGCDELSAGFTEKSKNQASKLLEKYQ